MAVSPRPMVRELEDAYGIEVPMPVFRALVEDGMDFESATGCRGQAAPDGKAMDARACVAGPDFPDRNTCNCAPAFVDAYRALRRLSPYGTGQTTSDCFAEFEALPPSVAALRARFRRERPDLAGIHRRQRGLRRDGCHRRHCNPPTRSGVLRRRVKPPRPIRLKICPICGESSLRAAVCIIPAMRPISAWLPVVLVLALAGGALAAENAATAEDKEESAKQEKTVCELIDEAAAAHALPVEFFTRLIWRESRFRAGALSPKGAQGIAQFMPATAARRRLADPFDPAEAIPASAHYLKDLAAQFGNLGLAAAAYNAGEERVGDWIAGSRRLPAETLAYVLFITGRPAGDWKSPDAAADAGSPDEASDAGCAEIAALLSKPGAGSARFSIRLGGTAEWAPWGVQVAGNFSASRALASYDALRRKHEALLGDREPLVVSAVIRSRGTAPFHHVRLPFETRDAADDLCRALRKAGGACTVLKNAR